MDQLIARIAAAAGISEELAQTAVKVIINFLAKEAPEEKVNQIVEGLGISGLLDGSEPSGGGMLGGLMGAMGGMGAAMAAMNELNSAGLSMGEIQTVASELITAAKEQVDDQVVDDVVSSVPGLSQIL